MFFRLNFTQWMSLKEGATSSLEFEFLLVSLKEIVLKSPCYGHTWIEFGRNIKTIAGSANAIDGKGIGIETTTKGRLGQTGRSKRCAHRAGGRTVFFPLQLPPVQAGHHQSGA